MLALDLRPALQTGTILKRIWRDLEPSSRGSAWPRPSLTGRGRSANMNHCVNSLSRTHQLLLIKAECAGVSRRGGTVKARGGDDGTVPRHSPVKKLRPVSSYFFFFGLHICLRCRIAWSILQVSDAVRLIRLVAHGRVYCISTAPAGQSVD